MSKCRIKFIFLSFYFHAINHNLTTFIILIFLHEIRKLLQKNLDGFRDNKRQPDVDERRDFLRDIGLPRHEAYDLAKELKFDVQYYREKRKEWLKRGHDHTQVDGRLLEELQSGDYKGVKANDEEHRRNAERDHDFKTIHQSDNPYAGFKLDFDYEIVPPKRQHNIDERREFLLEIGMSRHEAYDLAQEMNFDVQYYQKKRIEWLENGNRKTAVDARLLAELESGDFKKDSGNGGIHSYLSDIRESKTDFRVATRLQSDHDFSDYGGFKLDYDNETPKSLSKFGHDDDLEQRHSLFGNNQRRENFRSSRSRSPARHLIYMEDREYNKNEIHQQRKRSSSPARIVGGYSDNYSPDYSRFTRSPFQNEPIREYTQSSTLRSPSRNLNYLEHSDNNAKESRNQGLNNSSTLFGSGYNFKTSPGLRNEFTMNNLRSMSRSPIKTLNYSKIEREYNRSRSERGEKNIETLHLASSSKEVDRNINSFQLFPRSPSSRNFDYLEEKRSSEKNPMDPSPNRRGFNLSSNTKNSYESSNNDFPNIQGNVNKNISTKDKCPGELESKNIPLAVNQQSSTTAPLLITGPPTQNVSVNQTLTQLLQNLSKKERNAIKIKKVKLPKIPGVIRNRIDIYKKKLGYFKVIKCGLLKPLPGHIKANPEEYWSQWWSMYYIENAVPKVDPNDAEIVSSFSFLHKPNEPEFYKRKEELLKSCHKMDCGFHYKEKTYPYWHSFKKLILKNQVQHPTFQSVLSLPEMRHVEINLKRLDKSKMAFLHQSLICRWYSAMDIVKRVSKGDCIKIKKSLRLLKQNLFHYLVMESIRELKVGKI